MSYNIGQREAGYWTVLRSCFLFFVCELREVFQSNMSNVAIQVGVDSIDTLLCDKVLFVFNGHLPWKILDLLPY